jgi:GNAT superfamily N-acetyltransferase
MLLQCREVPPDATLGFRERQRQELHTQITHDSIHRRPGWTVSYLFEESGHSLGFGSVAVGGPWKGKPAIFEFYVLPEHRGRAFEIFERLVSESGAPFMEVQSSDLLLTAMLHTYAENVVSESVVFRDELTTALALSGATLRPRNSEKDLQKAIECRQGGGEWTLELEGQAAGTGGILFHYNRPYGDIYMEVAEPFRRRGIGSFLVQELKRIAYELGAIPAARCNPSNVASRRTLQKAGFVPYSHILTGSIKAQNKC